MRLAVASDDGKIVNQHFGHAVRFLIYDVIEGRVQYVEERDLEQYCTGDPNHSYEQSKIDKVYSVISDCQFVLCSMIGTTPEYQMALKGVNTFRTYGIIEEEILKLYQLAKDGIHVTNVL